jgi:Chitobiase/beta-hexosaminidase C-terminal domain
MASYTVTRSAHETLAATTEDDVTITDPQVDVAVTNRSGSAEIYFTIDGSTPTVGGENTFVLPAATCSREVSSDKFNTATPVVKLISTGTPDYSVESL